MQGILLEAAPAVDAVEEARDAEKHGHTQVEHHRIVEQRQPGRSVEHYHQKDAENLT